MASWLNRQRHGIQSAPVSAVPFSATRSPLQDNNQESSQDRNAPDGRLDVETICVYERRLPGNAYVSAHINRLQKGYYDSPLTSGDTIQNVRFIALNFTLHPYENSNRFTSAIIKISLHDDTDGRYSDPYAGHKAYIREPINKPKFLRFAPHLIYGGVSPENLDFNFQIAGSLGVSQAPASASLNPSADWKSSYKVFQMMKIQGSTRVMQARHLHEYDIQDGEVYWTMEENVLQRSGLPREFTFIMMISKGDVENVALNVRVEPKIASWFGHYPAFWNGQSKYQPIKHRTLDLDQELGQMFEPRDKYLGYNFALLARSFNNYVALPGTTFSTKEQQYATPVNKTADDGQDTNGKPKKAPIAKSAGQNHEQNGEGLNPGVLNIYMTNPNQVSVAQSVSPAPSARSLHARSVSHATSRSPARHRNRSGSRRPHPHLITRGISSPAPDQRATLIATGPVHVEQMPAHSTVPISQLVQAPVNGPPTPQSLPKRRSINIVGMPRQSSLRRSRSKTDLRSSSPTSKEYESPGKLSPYDRVSRNEKDDDIYQYVSGPSSAGTTSPAEVVEGQSIPVSPAVQRIQPSAASRAAQKNITPIESLDRNSYAQRTDSRRLPRIDDWPYDYTNGEQDEGGPSGQENRRPRSRDSPSPLRSKRDVGSPINGVSNRTKRYSMPA